MGGAGTILKSEMTPALEHDYLEGLRSALRAGYSVLEKGGAAIDAAIAATVVLEDNILFNAGRGSVFTKKGIHEMDAIRYGWKRFVGRCGMWRSQRAQSH
jgi:beta-aspartyl-peptidase (threonine type)